MARIYAGNWNKRRQGTPDAGAVKCDRRTPSASEDQCRWNIWTGYRRSSEKISKKYLNFRSQEKVDYATWYKISGIYVEVSRIAELV